MAAVAWRPEARADLIAIWQHIAPDSPTAADHLLDRIVLLSDTIAGTPLMGRRREELGPNLRSFVVANYVIFYEPNDDGVDIVRVLHGHTDIEDAMNR